MKTSTLILITFLTLLCSCNNHNDLPGETTLPIAQTYLPVTLTLNRNDSELVEKIKPLVDEKYIINDLSELPQDPWGFSEAYNNINFKQNTLLVTYSVHTWEIDTYRNRYYRDNVKRTYNWSRHVGYATSYPDDEYAFTRFAILVNKIPADAEVDFWLSLGSLNWEWD